MADIHSSPRQPGLRRCDSACARHHHNWNALNGHKALSSVVRHQHRPYWNGFAFVRIFHKDFSHAWTFIGWWWFRCVWSNNVARGQNGNPGDLWRFTSAQAVRDIGCWEIIRMNPVAGNRTTASVRCVLDNISECFALRRINEANLINVNSRRKPLKAPKNNRSRYQRSLR